MWIYCAKVYIFILLLSVLDCMYNIHSNIRPSAWTKPLTASLPEPSPSVLFRLKRQWEFCWLFHIYLFIAQENLVCAFALLEYWSWWKFSKRPNLWFSLLIPFLSLGDGFVFFIFAALRYTTTENEHKDSAARLTNHLVNIRFVKTAQWPMS